MSKNDDKDLILIYIFLPLLENVANRFGKTTNFLCVLFIS